MRDGRFDTVDEALDNVVGRLRVQLARENFAGARIVIDKYEADLARDRQRMSVEETLDLPVHALLSPKTANLLEGYGVRTVRALVALTPHHIFAMKNCGQITVNEITKALGDVGLYLRGMEPSDG